MYMVKRMDAGDIIFQQPVNISPDETYSTLYEKMCTAACEVIYAAIGSLFCDSLRVTPQNEEKATYCYKITREDEHLDWNMPNFKVDSFVRSLADKPYAYSNYNEQPIKICQGKSVDNFENANPGTILKISKEGILVKCLSGAFLVNKLQIPGKNVMLVKDILNGLHFFEVGETFI